MLGTRSLIRIPSSLGKVHNLFSKLEDHFDRQFWQAYARFAISSLADPTIELKSCISLLSINNQENLNRGVFPADQLLEQHDAQFCLYRPF